jgi:hypothetical protein
MRIPGIVSVTTMKISHIDSWAIPSMEHRRHISGRAIGPFWRFINDSKTTPLLSKLIHVAV